MTRRRSTSVAAVLATLLSRHAAGLRPCGRRCQRPGCQDFATIYGYCFDHGG